MKHSNRIGMVSAYFAVAAMTTMMTQCCSAASDDSESEPDESVQATRVAGSTHFSDSFRHCRLRIQSRHTPRPHCHSAYRIYIARSRLTQLRESQPEVQFSLQDGRCLITPGYRTRVAPKRKNPTFSGWGFCLLLGSLTITYFHTGNPHYHRRGVVSRSCSGWEGVVPTRYGHQA